MRDNRPQSIENLFEATEGKGTLQSLQQRAIMLNKLNRAVQGVLPAPLHPWCRVANFRQGILVLETANASWMMRLRYEQSSLLSALRAQILPSLTAIDIRINPSLAAKGQENAHESSKQDAQPSAGRQLSEQSAEMLRSIADRSPEKLKRVIERLASLAGESTSSTSRNK
ncbi:DUF721 domain-containing protein [Erwinia psidii]|uniref:DUF721 domain-containing protein n=1 Tax=Erwinia psidii TaxID=69224 RepID=A0A3N6S218_9GAMM|nr:DciA family protein [Erwinia psidii]MCX8957568.1 DUF721 domain-containing protein [Erwinia psidii]MCX8960622.1 DUF721 domain-containing protein [Erwinia psidii]MCX8964133.1 DUF721 domain-containing protein [Erwinia psidii]RQM39614.1 DUF721 domain-containing protein [Erwinia psidii]